MLIINTMKMGSLPYIQVVLLRDYEMVKECLAKC